MPFHDVDPEWEKKYKTLEDHYDGEYDTVVCAAAPGSMLLANRDPVSDERSIDQLMQQLSALRCNNFILISTIAVLADHCESKSEDADDLARQIKTFFETERLAGHIAKEALETIENDYGWDKIATQYLGLL